MKRQLIAASIGATLLLGGVALATSDNNKNLKVPEVKNSCAPTVRILQENNNVRNDVRDEDCCIHILQRNNDTRNELRDCDRDHHHTPTPTPSVSPSVSPSTSPSPSSSPSTTNINVTVPGTTVVPGSVVSGVSNGSTTTTGQATLPVTGGSGRLNT